MADPLSIIGAVVFGAVIVLVPLICGLPVGRLLATGGGTSGRHGLCGLGGAAGLVATWLVGVVLSSVLAVIASAAGLAWSAVAPVALAVAVVLERLTARHARAREARGQAWTAPLPWSPLPWSPLLVVLVALVVAVVAVALAAAAATSVDLAFFWGPKALGFARADGIDWAWQRQPYMIHTHITYPPAWTVLLAWGAEAAGRMPWMLVPWLTLIGLVAAVPLIRALLAEPLGRDADPVVGLWLVALAVGLTTSLAAGNAAVLLLLFETTAVAALIGGPAAGPGPAAVSGQAGRLSARSILAALCLAGAVLTKSEGGVAVLLVLGGVAVRGLLRREPGLARRLAALGAPALGAYLLWLGVRLAHGLPLADPIRERALAISFSHLLLIAKVGLRCLGMGTAGLSWLLPLLLVVLPGLRAPRARLAACLVEILPALALSLGLPAFAAVYYLHVQGDVAAMITWTLPRLALPALSAWILGAGVLAHKLHAAACADPKARADLEGHSVQA